MDNSASDPKIKAQLDALERKYSESSQDMASYLEGLRYTDYLSYWDYIHLDALISLQNPRTTLPDEMVFIGYHQITELYFKLILWEMDQLTAGDVQNRFFIERVTRIIRYFEILVHSFDVMGRGMEPEQFLKFRLALLPASGFQSVQFRMIEIYATDCLNLVDKDLREQFNDQSSVEEVYQHLYWKKGAMVQATGKPTLTLQQFEKKYEAALTELIRKTRRANLWTVYQRIGRNGEESAETREVLRRLDSLMNIEWALAHFKSASYYLDQKAGGVPATGGTNWQNYLPPMFQRRIFYPELWSDEEKQNWGKDWVEKNILHTK